MWKFVTRSIHESLERRVCRTNIYSQSSQNNTTSNNEQSRINASERKYIAPSFSAFYHGCCSNSNHLGTKDKEGHNKYDAKYTWTDAVGWSSILAVGYVVCQSLCIRRKLFDIDTSHLDKWRTRLIINPRNQATQIFSHLLLPEPKYILPISKEVDEPADTAKLLVDTAPNVEKPYGPLTAEEALEEAAKEFACAHDAIIGNLELNFGSVAIEEQRYDDAFEHFNNGAELSSAGSIFNLGLCHELGLGTSKDYSKALQYYNQAADQGHPDAMYNLGVFHAQGKGGLKINLDVARQLFTGAAQKGHSQAIKALQLEKSFNKRSNLEPKTKYKVQTKTMNNSLDADKADITKMTSYDSPFQSTYSQKYDFDQYLGDYNESLESNNSTDIFLEILGAHERNVVPLISVGESRP